MGFAFDHAHLVEVKAGVVLEEQAHGNFAVVAKSLQAIDVRGLDLVLGAAVVIVATFDAALAEKVAVITVVIFVAGGVHKEAVDLVVFHQPIVAAQDEPVLAVVNTVIGDAVVGHGGIIARPAIGAECADNAVDPGHHVENVIVKNFTVMRPIAQLHGRSRLGGGDGETFHAHAARFQIESRHGGGVARHRAENDRLAFSASGFDVDPFIILACHDTNDVARLGRVRGTLHGEKRLLVGAGIGIGGARGGLIHHVGGGMKSGGQEKRAGREAGIRQNNFHRFSFRQTE